jgi:hypothetical protein
MGQVDISPGSGGGGTSGITLAQLPTFPFANVVSTVNPLIVPGLQAFSIANHARGFRVVIPKAGTLKGFSIVVGGASGNCEGFILDDTPTTRQVKWSSGTKVVTGSNAWQNLGDPNVVVTAGQHLDFCLTCDNVTATFGRVSMIQNMSLLPAAYPLQSPNGAVNALGWDGAQTIPIGGTFAESSMGTVSNVLCIVCYLA